MIGWTLAALMIGGFLFGIVALGKYVTDSWAKSALMVGVAVVVVVFFMAAVYGAQALIEAGI